VYTLDEVTAGTRVLVDIAASTGYAVSMQSSSVREEVKRFVLFHKQWLDYDVATGALAYSSLQ